jgi:hypothetical protein
MNRTITACVLAMLAVNAGPVCTSQTRADESNEPSKIAQGQASTPEKLMKVVLKCDQMLAVSPLMSIGADVVNLGGKAKTTGTGNPVPQTTFECLPGGVVGIYGMPLLLQPEDDGKVLHLKFGGTGIYKNDCPCWITLDSSYVSDDKQTKEQLLLGLHAIEFAKKHGRMKGLLVNIPLGDASLPVLHALRGSGAGITFMNVNPADKKSRDSLSKEFVQAVCDVEPRQLMLDCRRFNESKDRLAQLEGLFLLLDPGDRIPDLSSLDNLRLLYLYFNNRSPHDENAKIDLKGLENMKQLKALTVYSYSPRATNTDILNSLSGLQFLFTTLEVPVLDKLHDMRYLGGAFPETTDFSFTEKMPRLQTLCCISTTVQHNFKPLEKAHSLRCLALDSIPDSAWELHNARPDVDVVGYEGMCLGSFWLLPAAGLAAFAAWQMRRRHHRGRGRSPA